MQQPDDLPDMPWAGPVSTAIRATRALAPPAAVRGLGRIAPGLLARLDEWRPELRSGFGGPLNGQARRQELVRRILRAFPFEAVVETGTHRGATTAFLRAESGLAVHTVEADPRLYRYARRRFRSDDGVRVFGGHSPPVLARLGRDSAVPACGVLFYLDAHGERPPPLLEELRTIGTYWSDWLVMIDDFAVPGDPGYGFDDYGAGHRLHLPYLRPADLPTTMVYWPSAPSETETGFRRGCVVLATPGAVAGALSGLPGLLPHPAPLGGSER